MRVIRYQTRPDKADDNQRYVEAVYRELQAAAPEGLRYLTIRLDDGTFIHVVETNDRAKLVNLPAFTAFQDELSSRCLVTPVVCEATVVGNFRWLAKDEPVN